jgi:hypothetical protein
MPLPGRVDAGQNLLTTQTSHLTVFDYTAESWQSCRRPGMEGSPASYSYDGTIQAYTFDDPPPDEEWESIGNVTYVGGALYAVGDGSTWNTYAARTEYGLKDGDAVRFTFKVSAAEAQTNLIVETWTWGERLPQVGLGDERGLPEPHVVPGHQQRHNQPDGCQGGHLV